MTARRASRGFTLLEVMIALAILAIGLTWMLRSTINTVRNAEDSRYYDVVTHLARGKMLDIEEHLRKEGFQESDGVGFPSKGDFGEEGWPSIAWEVEILKVELPSIDQIQAMAQQSAEEQAAAAAGAAAGSGTAAPTTPGGSLFGMLSMFGGGISSEDAAGGAFISMFYGIIQQVFEVSIRKVILTVKWTVIGNERQLKVVAYFTDPGAMNKVIGGLGAADAGAYGGN